jgi:hypothetical protein
VLSAGEGNDGPQGEHPGLPRSRSSSFGIGTAIGSNNRGQQRVKPRREAAAISTSTKRPREHPPPRMRPM